MIKNPRKIHGNSFYQVLVIPKPKQSLSPPFWSIWIHVRVTWFLNMEMFGKLCKSQNKTVGKCSQQRKIKYLELKKKKNWIIKNDIASATNLYRIVSLRQIVVVFYILKSSDMTWIQMEQNGGLRLCVWGGELQILDSNCFRGFFEDF